MRFSFASVNEKFKKHFGDRTCDLSVNGVFCKVRRSFFKNYSSRQSEVFIMVVTAAIGIRYCKVLQIVLLGCL